MPVTCSGSFPTTFGPLHRGGPGRVLATAEPGLPTSIGAHTSPLPCGARPCYCGIGHSGPELHRHCRGSILHVSGDT